MKKKRKKTEPKLRVENHRIWYELQYRLGRDILNRDNPDTKELYDLAEFCLLKLGTACNIIQRAMRMLDADERAEIEELTVKNLIKDNEFVKMRMKL